MAKCDLSIELADGDRLVRGGERVRGTVIVQPDGDFNCKGLEISTRWETHGRGNIAAGEIEKVVAFEGQWLAGQTYRYDFDLPSGTWPPTYHGETLNVDHVVRATARLPWKMDPTVAHPFRVYVTESPVSGAPPVTTEAAGRSVKLLQILAMGILAVVAIFILLNPFFWCIGVVIALAGAGWWFFRKVLPNRKLGKVEFRVETARLSPGETLRSELLLSPQQNVTLNGIELKLTAKEVCVSGVGTNRSTHTEIVFEDHVPVMAAGELQGGKEHRFPIEVTLPMRPIYSVDLSDNDVTWTADIRIDIPRWPDWLAQEKISVVPPSQAAAAAALLPGVSEAELDADSMGEVPADSGISFHETAKLIWANREHPEMVDQLVEAVQGLTMRVAVDIDRRSLYSEPSEPSLADPRGTVFLASCEDPPVPLMLYLPSGSPSRIAEIERQRQWSGEAQIVGYDSQQRRLVIRASEDQG